MADFTRSRLIAGILIEWLCGLFGESDPEAVKAHLVAEVVRRRTVPPETAWAWVEGREAPDVRQETGEMLQPCPQCQQPMSNLTGIYVLRKRGQTLEVCALCKDALMAEGWYLVAQQR